MGLRHQNLRIHIVMCLHIILGGGLKLSEQKKEQTNKQTDILP